MTERFQSVFDSKGDSFRIMQIINKSYSVKLKNHEAVTQLINLVLNTKYDANFILKFINQIEVYPRSYGFDSVTGYVNFNKKIIESGILLNMPTTILSPSVSCCVFCHQAMVIKNAQFSKPLILYGSSFLGNKF